MPTIKVKEEHLKQEIGFVVICELHILKIFSGGKQPPITPQKIFKREKINKS